MASHADGAAVTSTAPTREEHPAPGRPPTGSRTAAAWVTQGDLLALASFVAAAVALTARLWTAPADGVLNRQDQAFFEWMLAHGARVLTEGVNPFFSAQMNAPDGADPTTALGGGSIVIHR